MKRRAKRQRARWKRLPDGDSLVAARLDVMELYKGTGPAWFKRYGGDLKGAPIIDILLDLLDEAFGDETLSVRARLGDPACSSWSLWTTGRDRGAVTVRLEQGRPRQLARWTNKVSLRWLVWAAEQMGWRIGP